MKSLFCLSRIGLFLVSAAMPSLASNQVLLRYLNVGDKGIAWALASDGAGNLFTASSVTDNSGVLRTRIIKTGPNGTELASFDFAAATQIAAATDAQGNLIVVGVADRHGFPVSASSAVLDTDQAAFVLKLDSQLHGILFTKLFPGPSSANAVALDPNGNIFIAGATTAPDFPVTSGAFQSSGPVPTDFGTETYAFLTELSLDGGNILYSTFFGGKEVPCSGGSACIGVFAYTSINALALEGSGAVVVAGMTDASDFPVTPGALGGSCMCGNMAGSGFVAMFMPGAAQQLLWSAALNADIQVPGPQYVQITSLALDAAGNVIVGGSSPIAFPTTPGVLQPAPPPISSGAGSILDAGFVAKVNNLGTSLIWSTYFGSGTVESLALDTQGNVLLTGSSDPSVLPGSSSSPAPTGCFVSRISADAEKLINLFTGPSTACGQAVIPSASGNFVAMGRAGSLWIETSGSGGSLLATANAASGPASGNVAPAEIISLYGVGIGPQAPLGGQVKNGSFTSSLGGYQVLFDGVAAPLLYAGPSQFNAIVPGVVAFLDATHIQIVSAAGTIDGPTLYVRPSEPFVFDAGPIGFDFTELAAALNEDGTPNSQQNPAKPGSIVTIFATGTGATYWSDGLIVQASFARGPNLPVSVLVGNESLEVVYAGDAPGLVEGVMQINFRLPVILPTKFINFQLQAGAALSPPLAIETP